MLELELEALQACLWKRKSLKFYRNARIQSSTAATIMFEIVESEEEQFHI